MEDAGSGNGGNGSVWSPEYRRMEEPLDCLVWPSGSWFRATNLGLLFGEAPLIWVPRMEVLGDCDG